MDDVRLPPWAQGDAFEFVRIHREALESDYVSEVRDLHECSCIRTYLFILTCLCAHRQIVLYSSVLHCTVLYYSAQYGSHLLL